MHFFDLDFGTGGIWGIYWTFLLSGGIWGIQIMHFYTQKLMDKFCPKITKHTKEK